MIKTEIGEEDVKGKLLDTTLWERLKICWNFLTKKNYIYFGMSKNGITEAEEENTYYAKPNAFSCYIYTAPQKGIPFDTGRMFLASAEEYLANIIKEYDRKTGGDEAGEEDREDLEKLFNGEIYT